jgi:PIN domain nuclease of toxin-antitoxin system
MIVLDASAMLALLFDEAGADTVRDDARSADAVAMSAANYSEVLQKVRQRGGDVDEARTTIEALVEVEPVMPDDAVCAAQLWRSGEGLSLGDRLCLALAERLGCDAYAMDEEWGGHPHAHVVDRGG